MMPRNTPCPTPGCGRALAPQSRRLPSVPSQDGTRTWEPHQVACAQGHVHVWVMEYIGRVPSKATLWTLTEWQRLQYV